MVYVTPGEPGDENSAELRLTGLTTKYLNTAYLRCIGIPSGQPGDEKWRVTGLPQGYLETRNRGYPWCTRATIIGVPAGGFEPPWR